MSGIYYQGAFMRSGAARVSRHEPQGDRTIGQWLESPRPDAVPFEWGTYSPGCAELAYAILFDATGSEHAAEFFHLQFAEEILAHTWKPGVVLQLGTVESWLAVEMDTTRIALSDGLWEGGVE